jgi:hypothetical protein
MVKGTRTWIDGTLEGPDHVMELLAMHLHRLGAARARTVSFVADGAPWIWGRLDRVEKRVGLDPKRVERVLDTCHATHHISPALKALGLSDTERDRKYQELRRQLRAGRSRDVVASLRALAHGQPEDCAVWVEIEFLHKHEPHMRYDWLNYRGRPLGSGAIESAMRRVLHLRLKGNGIYWREQNAEGMLVLRAAVLTGRWPEVMAATHAAMGEDRRRG